MQLSDLAIAEARREPTGLIALIKAVQKEMGLPPTMGPAHALNDEIVESAVKMINGAVGHPNMGTHGGAAYPLDKLRGALKKMVNAPLFDIAHSLRQLEGLDGFMPDTEMQKMIEAASLIASRAYGMAEYTTALHSVMMAILQIKLIGEREKDAFKKSIAAAMVKKLGVE